MLCGAAVQLKRPFNVKFRTSKESSYKFLANGVEAIPNAEVQCHNPIVCREGIHTKCLDRFRSIFVYASNWKFEKFVKEEPTIVKACVAYLILF